MHVDFAGPFPGSMFIIVVDAMSKWFEVIQMSKTTSTHTIEVLRTIFVRNGIPSRVVTANGPQFTSSEFQQCMGLNGIKHIVIKTTSYHPSSNGLAERFVQSFKQAMRASKNDTGTISKKLAKFLLAYQSTSHQTTNETPSMLFMGRELKTRLHNIKPNIRNRVIAKQEEMCNRRNFHNRNFEGGQSVVVRDYRGNNKWTSGTIKQKQDRYRTV
jgi:transposase InsO family protein